jgi:hypothetical protein
MATYLDSPQGPFVSGSSLPSSLRFSASRIVFCLAIGVAAVAATGIMLARMDVPIGASSNRVKNTAISPATGISIAAIPNPPHAASRRSRIALSAQARSSAGIKMPDAVKPAIFRLNGKEFLVAQMVSMKMISTPVTEPVPANVTRASDSVPAALNPGQLSRDDAAKPASL